MSLKYINRPHLNLGTYVKNMSIGRRGSRDGFNSRLLLVPDFEIEFSDCNELEAVKSIG